MVLWITFFCFWDRVLKIRFEYLGIQFFINFIQMTGMKKIYYLPGLISAVLIPVLFILYDFLLFYFW